MKKIFAIALALVMVFSMASAFALNDCFAGFDWSCPTDSTLCGKAKFEVVPYVKVNNGCGGYDWQVSDCATAINSENVYFALRLTLDANVNPEWWAFAYTGFEWEGLNLLNRGWAGAYDALDNIAVQDINDFEYVNFMVNGREVNLKESESQVFYLDIQGNWVHEDYADFDMEDDDTTADVVFAAEVLDADDAEVCATIASENDGWGVWEYGDYVVTVATATDVDAFGNEFEYGYMEVGTTGNCWGQFIMKWMGGEVYEITASSAAFMNEVKAVFALTDCVVGTCVDDTIVKRNFGWDDEFEACFGWSNRGAAIVNPECVVAIPKTGDVSVVAYAVMAVVAAAGAMLKK